MENPFSRPFLLFSLAGVLATTLPCPADSPSPREFAGATPLQWSVRLADSEIARRGDSLVFEPGGKAKWDYTAGLFTLSLLKLGGQMHNPEYVKFAENAIGSFITTNGGIQGYKVAEYQLDAINPGKTVLALWQITHAERYQKAATLLRRQLDTQPRTSDGGFWHKQRYPRQMWLDGLYMAAPFYAEYAKLFNGPVGDYDDVAKQIQLVAVHTYDPVTGLFYHGWDESREQPWANKATGTSSNFWGRAIGWYAMALVDVLDYFPTNHPARPEIIAMFQKLCSGAVKYQDPKTGLWYQVVDQGDRKGNYLEATASSMFVYAMAKGVNRGYLPRDYVPAIEKGYQGSVENLVKNDGDGKWSLTQCCSVAGLGGTPGNGHARDGSFDYYVSEPIVNNDLKGVGSFILAGIEVQQLLNPPPTVSPDMTPSAILNAMQRVADWQLAHPDTNRPTGWIQAAGDAGVMALAGISGDAKYRDAMLAVGETNGWQLPEYKGRKYHADDQCIGQTYAELYLLYRENKMIAPMREHFDFILSHPTDAPNLDFTQPKGKSQELWSWCDALFMAPAAWLRLYAATDDKRYLDFAVTNFWRTTDYLYDTNEHLFFRDSTFFSQREANGQKVFWSRGNGWVMAGIVRTLQYLPMNHPVRPRFEQLFKDMAEKILTCQQPDGLWRASLLDPESYPAKETSGSGFFTYAFAWGVNQGLLDRAKFEPAVRKAWTALVGCVEADGKLTHVQPVGSDPKKFADDSTAPYGVGAFLLAGSEVYRMAVFEKAKRYVVKVRNPALFRRDCETVAFTFESTVLPPLSILTNFAVMDGFSSRILDSQPYFSQSSQENPMLTQLLFQVDLAPGETRTFYIMDAAALAAVPPSIVKTFARYVPERMDDFAWESDRIAHRTYGQALIKGEGTITSGPDVWIKRNRSLIVDVMYATKHYHEDNGEFMDDYRVGKSRGCGGIGIWDGQKLYTSSNYRNWRLITTGPIRSEFELTYDSWDVGNGRMVSETKRYSIDAGSWFTKAQSTFSSETNLPLTIGVGLAERACGPDGTELIAQDKIEGWMSYWQPEDAPKGTIGVAIVLPKGSVETFTNDVPDMPDAKLHAVVPQPTHEGFPPIRNLLAITTTEVGKPFTYYFGACWDRSGDFTNHVQWEDYVRRFAERRDAPLQVTIGN
jgi:rhamnogalacturonyl hydrolase YesR